MLFLLLVVLQLMQEYALSVSLTSGTLMIPWNLPSFIEIRSYGNKHLCCPREWFVFLTGVSSLFGWHFLQCSQLGFHLCWICHGSWASSSLNNLAGELHILSYRTLGLQFSVFPTFASIFVTSSILSYHYYHHHLCIFPVYMLTIIIINYSTGVFYTVILGKLKPIFLGEGGWAYTY